MALFNALYILILFLLVFVAPAFLMAWRYRQGEPFDDPVDAAASILGFALFVVSAMIFLAAAASLSILGPVFAAGTSLALIVLMHRQLWQVRNVAASGRFWTQGPGPYGIAALILAVLVVGFHLLFFDALLQFNFGCTYMPCAISAGLVELEDIGRANINLFYPDHQRMGVTAVISPLMAMFGMMGIRLFWALLMAFVPLSIYSTSRKLGLEPRNALFAGALSALLPAVVTVHDPNRILLAMTCFLAHAMATRLDRPVFLGGLLALVWGAEPALIVAAPALIWILLGARQWKNWRGKKAVGSLLRVVVGFGVVGLPFMLRLTKLNGNPISHEHFSYIPPQSYSFLGIDFSFRAFLNWPLYDHLVRSPYNPLPNLCLVPLTIFKHFGLVVVALVLCGFVAMALKKRLRLLVALALFFLAVAGLLAINENWSQRDKWGILVMTYAPLYLAGGFGLQWMFSRRNTWWQPAAVFAGALVLFTMLHLGLARVEADIDQRYIDSWSRLQQTLLPEEPVYMELERQSIKTRYWVPYSDHGPGAVSLSRWFRSLWHDLNRLDILQRKMSIAEAIHHTMMEEGKHSSGLKPAAFDLVGWRQEAQSYPIAFTLDLRRAPTEGFEQPFAKPVLRKPCQEPTTHLYPFGRLSQMQVPWNPEPIQIGLVMGGEKNLAMITLMRVIPKDETFAKDLNTNIPTGCVAFHLPSQAQAILFDFVSFDPSREYGYSVSAPDGPGGPVFLQMMPPN